MTWINYSRFIFAPLFFTVQGLCFGKCTETLAQNQRRPRKFCNYVTCLCLYCGALE
uniref:Uncharacterized protein n=1 Tax=Arundo donax TaxID=35708 RepID=A0A0A9E8M1_ARUDO